MSQRIGFGGSGCFAMANLSRISFAERMTRLWYVSEECSPRCCARCLPAFDPPAAVETEHALITDAPVLVTDRIRPPAIDDGASFFHHCLDRARCDDRDGRRVILHVPEVVVDA